MALRNRIKLKFCCIIRVVAGKQQMYTFSARMLFLLAISMGKVCGFSAETCKLPYKWT